MSLIEKLKGISNWQTVVVICFYISSVLAITIVAIMYNITWLIAGGATTLGIVAGTLTGVARQSFALPHPTTTVSNNPGHNIIDEQQKLDVIEKALAELSSYIVDMKTELVSLSSIDLDNNTSIHNNIGEKENE